ncbi:MAG: M20 family peptidase [Anaerolineae bacterium]|nr:M20 family peptidase [Gemmatimonadaceae bacterium]
MKKVLLGVGLAVTTLLAVVLIRALSMRSVQVTPAKPTVTLQVDREAIAQRLSGALRIRTISSEDSTVFAADEFAILHEYLRAAFPLAHARLEREVVGRASLLYKWEGSDAALPPLLLMGHMDVVPIEPGSEGQWTHPPYAGMTQDGFIWGRGAMDDKSAVLGILEGVELLLKQGMRPARTIYLAFGHDEEAGGEGAIAIAALLVARGVRPAMILDEGAVVAEGMLPGLSSPVALIGIAEKGAVSLVLTAELGGGHSSMPPTQTAVGVLSAAIVKLEEHTMPASIAGASASMFKALAPEMPLVQRSIFANLWLFEPLVLRQLAASPASNAMIRTTTAATMFEGSVKENVLPIRARAIVNFRLLPGDDVDDVIEHVTEVVADQRVKISVSPRSGAWNASPVSRTDGPMYEALARSVREVFPLAVVAPFLVVGATDARHFAAISPNTYRFLPLLIGPADLSRLHGTNERISVASYELMIRFYAGLIRNVAG